MTYDQWKTTDPSQEGEVCTCGSGEWATRIYGPSAHVRFVCRVCESEDDMMDRTLAKIDEVFSQP
jgi:hypothetical protein